MRLQAFGPDRSRASVPVSIGACLLFAAAVSASTLVIVWPSGVVHARPQDAAPPAGLIAGQAVDATSGKPLGGVTVTITVSRGADQAIVQSARGAAATAIQTPRVLTDADGHFVFHDLRKGSYTITATKSGYAAGAYGMRAPAGAARPLDLADGERKGDVTVGLWKLGAIGGRVVDEAGEPVIGQQVRVLHRAFAGGHQYFSQTGNQPQTDDRGVYRIGELMAGDYVVAVVTEQVTVPTAYQAAFNEAMNSGDSAEFRRAMTATGATTLIGGIGPGAIGMSLGDLSFTPGGPARPQPDPTRVLVYPTTFYPAAQTPAQATVITIGSGDEKDGVDFQIHPQPAVRISGVVSGPSGPMPNIGLRLLSTGFSTLQRDDNYDVATTISDGTGAFAFIGVPPGSYTVNAMQVPLRPVSTQDPGFSSVIQIGSTTISSGGGGPSFPEPIPKEPTLWAALPVSAGETDMAGLVVSMREGVRVSGHIEFDGTTPKPPADRLRQLVMQLDPANGRSGNFAAFQLLRGVIDADGQFNTYQVPAGRYLVRTSAPVNWTLKSIMFEGKDVSDAPFDLNANDAGGIVVTFTDHPTEISGTVRDATGLPDPTATLLVFPADNNAWIDYGATPRRLRSVRVQANGTYKLPGLPMGEYCIVAVPAASFLEWLDPAVLQKLQKIAGRITIGDGEKKSQDLITSDIK